MFKLNFRLALFIIFCLLSSILTKGEAFFPEVELSWKNVKVDEKKVSVFTIFQDSNGLVWIGTNSGLYFYDGINTHQVGEQALFGLQIFSLLGKDQTLYIGSNNGLFELDYNTGKIHHNDIVEQGEIRSLLLADDNLWVGGLHGISRYNLTDQSVEDYSESLPNKSVYSILRDSRGILYAGTFNGLTRFDSISKSFRPVAVLGNDKIPQSLFVNCLLETDNRESIFIGSKNSLYKYTPATDKWEKSRLVSDVNVKSLYGSDDGHVIIGTDEGVIDLYKDSVISYRHDSRDNASIADNEIWSVYRDNNHNIWAGHERGFSIASNPQGIKTINLGAITNSGEGNEIHKILVDNDSNLWLGGTNGLVRIGKGLSPEWFRHSNSPMSLSHNRIRDIFESEDHTLWFATDGGVNKLINNNQFKKYNISDSGGKYIAEWVYSIEEDNDNLLIGSFLGGIHGVNKKKFGDEGNLMSDFNLSWEGENPKRRLSNNLVNRIVKDNDGNIWVLLFRDNALMCFSKDMDLLRQYDIFKLTGGYPTHLERDKQGRIWCAYKGGVILFEKDKEPGIITFGSPGSDETVLAIGRVGDGVWLSTQSNVWQFEGENLNPIIVPIPHKSYTSIYEDENTGKVLLGGMDEIVEIDKDLIQTEQNYGRIKLILKENEGEYTDLLQQDNMGKTIRLPYGGSVSILMSDLDYSPNKNHRYKYKLADNPNDTIEDWIILPEGVNTINLSDLKWGNHHLLINTVGSQSKAIEIPIKVDPPMALSWWALSIYGLIIIGIILGIIFYLRQKHLKDLKEKERQEAMETAERKLTFLTGISHDIKTPLSMIIGPVSLLKEKIKDPENRKSLENVYNNAVRLNNMIHKTLELKHIDDASENMIILSRFDVVDFCQGILEVYEENNPSKKFIFHSSVDKITVNADAVKFESIINNLISNACKYTEDGATITCGIDLKDDKVEIKVSDDGIGISKEDQPFVFQRLFRSSSVSKDIEGNGLGLYLIKMYLEMMDGSIELDSEEGEGSTFTITLPLSESKSKTDESEKTDNKLRNEIKILIVEDNSQISSFISQFLKDKYEIITAENGREGLAVASSFLPDLMIVDEMMPVMSGMEMVRKLKNNPKLSGVPIIMLTAKDDIATENESIRAGIEVFMSKPFEPSALIARIEQLLKRRREIDEKIRIETIVASESKSIQAESANEKMLAKVTRVIEDNISDPDLNVNMLCEKCGLPNKNLYRLVKKHIGVSPLEYIKRIRLQKAAILISQQRFTISEICYMVGFNTPSYFAKCFQQQYGVKPTEYKGSV